MFETLKALDEHLSRARDGPARVAVWAHNSHLGDARATSMSRRGELNLGQLAREHWGDAAANFGFTTYTGTVMAADAWGGEPRVKQVVPALAESYERVLHDAGGDFALDMHAPEVADGLREPRLERAIGVIYRPETERVSHYFEASLPRQFDRVVHLDETNAVHPIEGAARARDELPETFPSGV